MEESGNMKESYNWPIWFPLSNSTQLEDGNKKDLSFGPSREAGRKKKVDKKDLSWYISILIPQ